MRQPQARIKQPNLLFITRGSAGLGPNNTASLTHIRRLQVFVYVPENRILRSH